MATPPNDSLTATQQAVPSCIPYRVLLVGSIPLSSTKDVFQELVNTFPNRLLRMPDGETGKRGQYVIWQVDLLKDYQVPLGAENSNLYPRPTNLKDIHTGFEDHAINSYREFCRLRDKGVIPKGIRFQVCLPTPLNVIACGVQAKYQAEVEPMYKAALLSALQKIQDEIPAHDLAIQWDAALEFAFIDMCEKGDQPYPEFGLSLKPWFSPIKEGIIERVIRVAESVREGVQMGLHLCYRDLAHKHFVEPINMSTMVGVANGIADIIKREINWIHMPVPKDRVDEEYYAPLKELKLKEGTEIYLGLAHAGDLEGTRRRIKMASQVIGEFGVLTECGLSRTPFEEFRSVLDIMATVTEPLAAQGTHLGTGPKYMKLEEQGTWRTWRCI